MKFESSAFSKTSMNGVTILVMLLRFSGTEHGQWDVEL
ncbi:hypothetical protein TELCIR_23345 [Teladorsagia circumcincta]|uniref:Uncharacterized protein n=1 Tax=Teladorsagia circumcincta TaxID=45464 RepID=A0A2G9TBD1_TELCI|nr:hypothetical protein TELCIR_23345 [Teladorsagia circumcincta]